MRQFRWIFRSSVPSQNSAAEYFLLKALDVTLPGTMTDYQSDIDIWWEDKQTMFYEWWVGMRVQISTPIYFNNLFRSCFTKFDEHIAVVRCSSNKYVTAYKIRKPSIAISGVRSVFVNFYTKLYSVSISTQFQVFLKELAYRLGWIWW